MSKRKLEEATVEQEVAEVCVACLMVEFVVH